MIYRVRMLDVCHIHLCGKWGIDLAEGSYDHTLFLFFFCTFRIVSRYSLSHEFYWFPFGFGKTN